MGELTAIELRTLASHQHYDGPLRQALQWAADRIDHLEGYIESCEAEEARRREGRAFCVRNDNTHSEVSPHA